MNLKLDTLVDLIIDEVDNKGACKNTEKYITGLITDYFQTAVFEAELSRLNAIWEDMKLCVWDTDDRKQLTTIMNKHTSGLQAQLQLVEGE